MLDVPQRPPTDERPGDLVPRDERPFGPEDLVPIEPAVQPAQVPICPAIDTSRPSPALAGFLSAIDVTAVSGIDRIAVLKAHQRMASYFQALVLDDMVAITDAIATDPQEPETDPVAAAEAAAAEIGVALSLARTASNNELAFALSLATRLPSLRDLLIAGDIDVRRARTIDHHTSHLSDEAARAVLDEIIDEAPDLTAGQLRARVRKLCIEVDQDHAKKRYDTAFAERRVVTEMTDDGTTNLLALDLAPDQVAAATDRIDSIARGMRGGDETRSMDQLRADAFVELLTGSSHETVRRGVVDIRVDLETLIGLNDNPGDLGGYGPVIADVARHVVDNADDSEWRVTVTDPSTGRPTHVGVTSRRPSAAQRRRIEIRDPMCVFPGCRTPARRSDIDHIISVQDGGETTDDNLAPLCRRHHIIKHLFGWTYRRRPDGRYLWFSKLGQIVVAARPPP